MRYASAAEAQSIQISKTGECSSIPAHDKMHEKKLDENKRQISSSQKVGAEYGKHCHNLRWADLQIYVLRFHRCLK